MANTNEGAAAIFGAVTTLEKAVCTASIKSLKKALTVLEIGLLGSSDPRLMNVFDLTKRRVEAEISQRSTK